MNVDDRHDYLHGVVALAIAVSFHEQPTIGSTVSERYLLPAATQRTRNEMTGEDMVTPAVLRRLARVYAEIVVGPAGSGALLLHSCRSACNRHGDHRLPGTGGYRHCVALALWPFRSRRFWSWTLLLLIMVVTEAMVEAHIGAPWVQPVAFTWQPPMSSQWGSSRPS